MKKYFFCGIYIAQHHFYFIEKIKFGINFLLCKSNAAWWQFFTSVWGLPWRETKSHGAPETLCLGYPNTHTHTHVYMSMVGFICLMAYKPSLVI